MNDILSTSDYTDLLLAEAGLRRSDFSGLLAVYVSAVSDRIVVVTRDPLHGESLLIPRPTNLYRMTHVNEAGDGQTVFYFDRVKAN